MTKADLSVVKKSISLSSVVAAWAETLAAKKGFGSNYSAYIADLIRRDKERHDELSLGKTSASKKSLAADAIVEVVERTARKKSGSLRGK